MSMVVEVTDENFQSEVLESELPVLVDYWAAWCGPCKIVAPLVEALSVQREGNLKVCKLDVDTHHQTAARYNVRSIPTLMVFKDGSQVDVRIGVLPKGELEQFVEPYLA